MAIPEVLRSLQDEFVRKYKKREIFWLSDIALEPVYAGLWPLKKLVEPAVEDLEELLNTPFYTKYPEDTLMLGPALGADNLPTGRMPYISSYVTQEGRVAYLIQQLHKGMESMAGQQE